jgi:hypothetical protein
MKFTNPQLSADHDAALRSSEVKRLAVAHNILFEERMSAQRIQLAEDVAVRRGAGNDIGAALEVHYKSKILAGDTRGHPTFSSDNADAAYEPIDEHEYLLRMENLSLEVDRIKPSKSNDVTADDRAKIHAAFQAKQDGNFSPEMKFTLSNFLQQWNANRDFRPMFAGLDAELGATALQPDWPVQLRDRLGLAHYNPDKAPMIVCLMRYQVAEVIQAAENARDPVPNRFLSPSVLDCGNWEYFFPAPKDGLGGRAVYLRRVSNSAHFFAEMLHYRIDYQLKHIFKVGVLNKPVSDCTINCMRNSHLGEVQLAFNRLDFGLSMPEACRPKCPFRP